MTENCPTCGQKIKLPKDTPYSLDFLEFWRVYDAPRRTPSASKSEGFKAWNQIEDKRPPIEALLSAVRAYHTHTDKNHGITCHPTTFLRQSRYENFLPKITTTDSMGVVPAGVVTSLPVPSVHQSWPGEIVVQISSLIGTNKFQTWLGDSTLQPGTPELPAIVTVNSPFKRDFVLGKFASALFRVLGNFEIEVSGR